MQQCTTALSLCSRFMHLDSVAMLHLRCCTCAAALLAMTRQESKLNGCLRTHLHFGRLVEGHIVRWDLHICLQRLVKVAATVAIPVHIEELSDCNFAGYCRTGSHIGHWTMATGSGRDIANCASSPEECDVAELLRLGAGEGGDALAREQLPRHAVDGRRGDQEARRQLQVAVVLHHAHEARLRSRHEKMCQ